MAEPMSPDAPTITDAELADAQTIRELLLAMADTDHRDRSSIYGEQCSCGGNNRPCPDEATIRNAASFMGALLIEVKQLREQLAEERASRNPLLRCIIVKAAPDRDLYVGWSNVVEAPTGMWTRAEALAYGFPRSRLDRADRTGTSSMVPGSGQWDDIGFIAEQRGWLQRDRIADYAQALFAGDENAAWDLLEPFEGETEVRRG